MMAGECPPAAQGPHHAVAMPLPAIKWILHNECSSNVQLATLANVCKSWRDECCYAAVAEAVSFSGLNVSDTAIRGCIESLAVVKESEVHDKNNLPRRAYHTTKSSLRNLLLIDMARELIVRQGTLLKSQGKSDSGSTDGSFCLAWFAPSGIQITSVSLDGNSQDTETDGLKFNFGRRRSESNEENKRQQPQKKSIKCVSCCREWRGYRHVSEILAPFGFATSFVQNVLDISLRAVNASILKENRVVTTIISSNPTLSRSASELSQTRMSQVSSLNYKTTFSVRGATLARAEGYCLCLEDEFISQQCKQQKAACIDGWMTHSVQEINNQHGSEGTLSPPQRAKKQSIIARALLPKVIKSTRRKVPIMYRFAEDADNDKGYRDKSIQDPHETNLDDLFEWEKCQRAIQFLNCDRSQAVRLITPPFNCGGVKGPITIFIVAITTEDGCFLSGRKSRFEFGHMYPLSNRDMMVDMSPICIASGNHDTGADTSSSSSGASHCFCPFKSSDPFNPTEGVTINDPSEDCIYRGTLGPGLWHCYVCQFDGQSSFIRVDGEEEPQQTSHHNGFAEGSNDADNPRNAGRLVGSGILDGLTIGSDHHFDMSLCYGEIDGECGQGAISELALFRGRMELTDITKLESYLMNKHGILSAAKQREMICNKNETRVKPMRIGNQWEEDEWRRQAHALIAQRPPWELVGEPVPLRAAANHNSVSWQRVDEITGTPLRVTRIGCKNGKGSSDW